MSRILLLWDTLGSIMEYHLHYHRNHMNPCFYFFILYNHLLHEMILCRILYWKVCILVSLTVLKVDLNILGQTFDSAVLKSG